MCPAHEEALRGDGEGGSPSLGPAGAPRGDPRVAERGAQPPWEEKGGVRHVWLAARESGIWTDKIAGGTLAFSWCASKGRVTRFWRGGEMLRGTRLSFHTGVTEVIEKVTEEQMEGGVTCKDWPYS